MEKKLLTLVKQCLSIVETATLKDEEINMLINAAKSDLERLGIKIDMDDKLIQTAIVMFVKANFGNTDIKEKELAQRTYSLLCNNLSLTTKYKEEDSNV